MNDDVSCPGCRLALPRSAKTYEGYFHCSPECWSVFGEVLEAEFSNVLLFRKVHQLTVDTYAVQHAGGPHPDKSVAVHVVGLCLAQVHGIASPDIAPRLQALASRMKEWPHFEAPIERAATTIFDVAAASSLDEHVDRVRAWSREVWSSWAAHHDAVRALATRALGARG